MISTSDSDISYVTDNERDAEALHRRTGSPVVIRRWVLQESTYRLPTCDAKTSRRPERPRRLITLNSRPYKL